MDLEIKSEWWFPKASSQKGEIWINESTISQQELNRVALIANICLAEICLGTLKNQLFLTNSQFFNRMIFY